MLEVISGCTGDIWPEKGMTQEELDKSNPTAIFVILVSMQAEDMSLTSEELDFLDNYHLSERRSNAWRN